MLFSKMIDTNAKGLLAVFFAYYSVALLKWVVVQPNNPVLFWIVDVFAHLVFPIILLFILSTFFVTSPRYYGLSNFPKDDRRLRLLPATVTYTIVLGAVYFIGYVLGRLLETYVWPDSNPIVQYDSLLPTGTEGKVFLWLYFSLSASIFEEIFFRGIFQLVCDAILSNPARVMIVVASGLVFSSTHWASGIPAITSSLLFGFTAALFYSYQRDLRPLVLAHFLINTLVSFQQ